MHAILEGAKRRRNREWNERAWSVWHAGVIPRMKRIPKLKDMQVGAGRRRPQTTDEMIAAARAWTAAVNRR